MARSAFKAFLNLLPVLPALLVAFSCSREEYEPLAEGISHNGREDGRLVFRAAAPDTKAPAFSRDTVLTLTENGEKSPFTLKVSTGSRAVASEGTKTADNPYSSDNPPERFNFRIFSQDGGAQVIDTDEAVRSGDRWISRKDWSEKIPSYVETPTICAWVQDDNYGYDGIYCSATNKIKTFYCDFVNPAHPYVCGNDTEAADHLWGYGVYSGLRADNSITFRHVNAGLCIHCAPALDMTVRQVDITARLDGSTTWTAGPDALQDVYSYDMFGIGVETLSRTVNASLSSGDVWIIPRECPVILPPQCGTNDSEYLTLSLAVDYDGLTHVLQADISDIEFYSGSMTTLEVTMDSFLWINTPDVNCPWSWYRTGDYESAPSTVTVLTNIGLSDFANRTIDYVGRYCSLYEYDNNRQLTFTPRWDNFTSDDWTEDYTVSCSGVSSTGTVTVEGGHASWGIESWNVPRYLFLGKTYDTEVRVRDINTNVIYLVAPFLMDWNYGDNYISIANGIITPVAQTPSVQNLEGTINADGGWASSFSAPYEVISPFLSCNPPYMEFGSSQVVSTAVTSISRELRDTLVDGRRLWVVPEDMTVTFGVPDGTAKFSVGIEYYAYSGNRSLEVNFGGTNLFINCLPGHHGNMSTTAYFASFSSASITAVGGPVAVDLFTIYKQISTVYSRDTWEVSSKPDWVMTWPDVGQPMGSISNTPSTNNIFAVVLPNTTGQARGGYITLTTTDGSDLTATIAVTQAAGSGWDFGGGSGWGTGGGTEVGF